MSPKSSTATKRRGRPKSQTQSDGGLMQDPSTHDVEVAAYFVWLNKGGGDGHDLADWVEAQQAAGID